MTEWFVNLPATIEEIKKISTTPPKEFAEEAWQDFARVYLDGGIMICHPKTWAVLKEAAEASGFDTSKIRVRQHPFIQVGMIAAVEISGPSRYTFIEPPERLSPEAWKALMEGSWENPKP
jgi:hypothetical protein